MKISLERRSGILVLLIIGCYLLLGGFSEAWLLYVGRNRLGHDFSIYYEAFSQASVGRNPYTPYQVGTSFLYHPFSLSILSILALFGYTRALAFWLGASLVAWTLSIAVLMLLVRQSPNGAHDSWLRRPAHVWLVMGLLLAFGPFIETFHVGQINTFVLMSLVLAFYYSENEKQGWAGFWFAVAVSFKTAPVILALYFVVVRCYRTLIAALIAFATFTLIAAAQFGPAAVFDFLAIIPSLGSNIHPSVNNQSWTSLLQRAALFFDVEVSDALMLSHQIGVVVLLGLLCIAGIRIRAAGRPARAWLFGSFVMVMVIGSPLVWYHHSVFLLIPLAISLQYKSRSWLGLGLGVLLLIQVDRFFEFATLRYAAPVVVAHFLMIIALAVTYFQGHHSTSGTQR